MDLAKAVVVPKATKVEHDMQRFGLTREALAAYYRAENAEMIFASHDRQLEMRERMRRLVPEARFVTREQVSREALRGASLVIALGGDNHFIYLSHFVDDVPILGINADRVRSHGGLLAVTEENLESILTRVREGKTILEAWSRLDVAVDGKPIGRATSEVLLAEKARRDMTRHVLQKNNGPEEEQKCSGLLVATGAGSTGWYGGYGTPFARTAALARWVATEPFPHDHHYAQARGELAAGDVLTVRSRNDEHAVVSIDCLEDGRFDYGAVATVRLSTVALQVVVLGKP